MHACTMANAEQTVISQPGYSPKGLFSTCMNIRLPVYFAFKYQLAVMLLLKFHIKDIKIAHIACGNTELEVISTIIVFLLLHF